MRRNLGSARCAVCDDQVALEEAPRPIRASECEPYASAFVGKMTVANARCAGCGALYLAWIRRVDDEGGRPSGDRDLAFVDLSFRRSFGEEPLAVDLPPVAKLREIHRRDCLARAAQARQEAARLLQRADEMEREGDGPSRWEAYLRRAPAGS